MKRLVCLTALVAALLVASVATRAQEMGPLTGTPTLEETTPTQTAPAVQVDGVTRPVTVSGNVNVGGTVTHTGTVKLVVDQPATRTVTKTRTVKVPVYRTKTVKVPGPERVVEKIVEKPAPPAEPEVIVIRPETTGTTPAQPEGDNNMLWILGALILAAAATAIIAIITSNNKNIMEIQQRNAQTNQLQVGLQNQVTLAQQNGRTIKASASIFPNGGGVVNINADDSRPAAQPPAPQGSVLRVEDLPQIAAAFRPEVVDLRDRNAR